MVSRMPEQSMSEVQRIADQVDCAYREGAWVGVSVRDLFRGLTVAEAAGRPVRGAHSAWEIALHLSWWHDAVGRRIGGETVDYRDDEDWPAIGDASEASWQAAIDRLDRSHVVLVDAVQRLSPARLDELVQDRPFTVSVMLHGVAQHNLYHAGQVIMLRKAWSARQAPDPS